MLILIADQHILSDNLFWKGGPGRQAHVWGFLTPHSARQVMSTSAFPGSCPETMAVGEPGRDVKTSSLMARRIFHIHKLRREGGDAREKLWSLGRK